jgi:hypothetical protein
VSPGASDDTDAIVHRCLDQVGKVKVFVSEISESVSRSGTTGRDLSGTSSEC